MDDFHTNANLERAVELLARLDDKTTNFVNGRPVTPLDRAEPGAVATAALAHAVVALVEEVQLYRRTLD